MAARKNKSIEALAAAAKREANGGSTKTTTGTRKKRAKKGSKKRRAKKPHADIGKLADAVNTVNKARRLLADAGCSLSSAPRVAGLTTKKATRRRRKKA